jgi:diguanylate cyclase (GGDEF)-like protein
MISAGPAARSSSVDASVRDEQLRQLFRHGALAVPLNIIAAALLFMVVRGDVPIPDARTWLAFFAAAWLARCLLYFTYWRRPLRFSGPQWLWLFAGGTLLGGCSWGSAALWFFPHSMLDQFLIAFAIMGLTAGAAVGVSCVRGITALYIFPAVLPIAIRFALESGALPVVVTLAVLYAVGMTLAGNMNNALLVTALRLRFKNYELVQELEALATRDALTGLPNRLLLDERLASALRRADRAAYGIAIVFVDCDGFKYVNDRYGHAAGDNLLKGIALALLGSIREIDTVARLGGDEFIVLLENCGDRSAVEQIVQRMRLRALQPVTVGSNTIVPKLSMGVTLYSGDGADGETLIRQADRAMYEAKRSGGNCIRFDAALEQSARQG